MNIQLVFSSLGGNLDENVRPPGLLNLSGAGHRTRKGSRWPRRARLPGWGTIREILDRVTPGVGQVKECCLGELLRGAGISSSLTCPDMWPKVVRAPAEAGIPWAAFPHTGGSDSEGEYDDASLMCDKGPCPWEAPRGEPARYDDMLVAMAAHACVMPREGPAGRGVAGPTRRAYGAALRQPDNCGHSTTWLHAMDGVPLGEMDSHAQKRQAINDALIDDYNYEELVLHINSSPFLDSVSDAAKLIQKMLLDVSFFAVSLVMHCSFDLGSIASMCPSRKHLLFAVQAYPYAGHDAYIQWHCEID